MNSFLLHPCFPFLANQVLQPDKKTAGLAMIYHENRSPIHRPLFRVCAFPLLNARMFIGTMQCGQNSTEVPALTMAFLIRTADQARQ